MSIREIEIRAPDGRTLMVQEAGDPDGFPVLVHHGTPCSRLLLPPWVEDAERRGIRLIGHDRPGYGGSDPKPGRRLSDEAGDAAAIADALGIGRFATWGISGGGAPALACAALLPDRVTAAASLAGVNPYELRGDALLEGMGADNIKEYGAALEGEDALRPLLERWRTLILEAGPEAMEQEFESLLSDVDRAVENGPLSDAMARWTEIGIQPGPEGWLEDDLSMVSPWGFDVSDIRIPVLILQGRQDLMVPFSHGEWFAANIPTAEAWLTEEDGHLTLIAERIPDVHAWLLEKSGASSG